MSAPDPRDGEEPVFAEPWEATAFALAVAAHERGLFGWDEWAERLGARRARRPHEPYYRAWLATLETLLAEKGIAPPDAVDTLQRDWQRAAEATPNGRPITLARQA